MKKKLINTFTRGVLAAFSSKRAKLFAVLLVICLPLVTLAVVKWQVSAQPCPCSVFPVNPTPQGTDNNGSPLEVGFKFRSSLDGYVTGVRFFKMAGMTGTHTGSLWDNQGNRLATATFSSETASGWQEVLFSSPVQITANTVYTASTFMTNGVYAFTANYFASPVVNDPLTAPAHNSVAAADAFDNRGQGVTNLSGSSVYPTDNFNAANYWVDVSFKENINNLAPTVSSTSPADGATGVNSGASIQATFDINMYSGSFSTSTFIVRDDQNNVVPGSVSFNYAAKKATFVATNGFTPNKTYTAILEGGSGTTVQSLDGIPMASDYTWTFTTASTEPCPCTLKDRANPAGTTTADDSGELELGVKITPQVNGYITAIRFYKPIISTETTHTGRIWNATGTSLATATFSNESEYGWQEAKLSSPLQVFKDQLYIVSYGTTTATYVSSNGYLVSDITGTGGGLVAYANEDSRNAATGSNNRNGVFNLTAGAFPDAGAAGGNYYWIDAVFSPSPSAFPPLEVGVTQPKNNTFGIQRNKPITASFKRALNAGSVTSNSLQLFDKNNAPVAGNVTYDSSKHSVVFTPSSNLTYGEKYTAKLASTIADTGGMTLGSDYTWSFTVGSQLGSNPAVGWTGGPLLLITSTGNNYSKYYAEILRTEGLNYFEVKDIAAVTASTLNNYNAVLLSDMSLSQSQADMFSSWVTAGGNLVAMRPDKKLAGLLGLTDASSTRLNQYLKAETGAAPGQGIVNESIQYKGTADNYTMNGATAVANLYSDATTATTNPAATTKAVGTSGGTAMAFTFDLARSVIALHQGNQSWAGDDRHGDGVRRSSDLFFGAKTGDIQPDWVSLDKIHIPQADEQQRLLANMLTEAVKDKKPLPRFWYLPQGQKAAMVLAGDDHGLGNNDGTERILNNWLNESSTDCSALDWECVRASHYTYSTAALTNTRAAQYLTYAFELGSHPSNGGGCNDYSGYAQLTSLTTAHYGTWRAKYTSIPNQRSSRFHCYVWSDWDSKIRVDADNGVRYDMDYVAHPLSWVSSRSPIVTGSGMNMRFTDASGNLMDVYQGVTNLDDTAANATSIAALLDAATGSAGYYGIFGTHYDMSNSYDRTLFTAAKNRNIPMISSDQALTWLDGRNSSNFSNFSGSNGQFTFTLNAAEGATGLKAMLPINDAAGTLSTLKLDGSSVTYQTQAVKGVQYAVFDGAPGSYTATYSDYDPNPDTGGGNSGGGSSTPSTDSGSSSSGSSKKKRTTFSTNPTGTGAPQTDENKVDAPTDHIPPTSTDDSEKREKDLIEKQNAEEGSILPVVLVSVLIAIAVGLGLWWFILARRRRKNQQLWQ